MTNDLQTLDVQALLKTLTRRKAPLPAVARIQGRKSSDMPGAATVRSDNAPPPPPPPLPPLGASMRRFSARMAARRFGEMLDAARIEPVIIDRRGRPCAVIMSIDRFDLYQRLLRERSYSLAAESLFGSIKATREGRFQTAGKLRLEAARIGFFADRRRR